MALTIRDARAVDVDDIARLLGQLGYATVPEAVTPRLERLAVVGDRVLIAVDDGRVVGLAHLQVSPTLERERPAARIGALIVDESHRGRGVGRGLVQALEDEARLRGCGVLFLTTGAQRDDAHTFYERVGFAQSGRRYSRTLSE
jgi:GNAT superfamily N-acetyltransferase